MDGVPAYFLGDGGGGVGGYSKDQCHSLADGNANKSLCVWCLHEMKTPENCIEQEFLCRDVSMPSQVLRETGAVTAVSAITLFVLYWRVRGTQRHPASVLLFRSFMEMCQAGLTFSTLPGVSCCNTKGAILGALMQFVLLSTDLSFFFIMLDVVLGLNNPFRSPQASARFYIALTLAVAFISSITLVATREYGPDGNFGLCWVLNSGTSKLNPEKWILGYVPIVVVLCATVTLTAISFRMLRMRRFVRRSLRKRDQLQLSLLLVSVIYCAYMVTMISIFGINYLVNVRGGKPYPSNTLAAIFGALLGSRGILTLIIFSTLGESSLRVYWRNLRSRARDVGMFKAFCENERALADAYRAKRKASRAASASTAVLFQSTAPASVYTERSDSVRSDTEGDVTDEDDDNGLEPNVNRWLREEIELFTQAGIGHLAVVSRDNAQHGRFRLSDKATTRDVVAVTDAATKHEVEAEGNVAIMAGLIMDEAAMDTAATVPEEGDDNPRVLRSLSSHLPVRHWQGHTVEMSASSLEEGTRRNSDGLEAGLLRNDFLRPAPLGGATHDSGLQGTRHWASTTQLRSPRRVEQEREHSAPLLSGSTSAPPGGEEAGGIASPSPAPVDRGAASHTGSASSLEQDPTQASAEGAGTEGAAPDAPPGQALKEEERSLSRKVFGLESEVPRKEPVAQVTEYCPGQFFVLRKLFGYDPASYAESVSRIGAGRIKGGRSGAFFFITQDQRLIMKTISKADFDCLLDTLGDYVHHVLESALPEEMLSGDQERSATDPSHVRQFSGREARRGRRRVNTSDTGDAARVWEAVHVNADDEEEGKGEGEAVEKEEENEQDEHEDEKEDEEEEESEEGGWPPLLGGSFRSRRARNPAARRSIHRVVAQAATYRPRLSREDAALLLEDILLHADGSEGEGGSGRWQGARAHIRGLRSRIGAPHTIFNRFLGCYSIKVWSRMLYFIVVENAFPPSTGVHEQYDLKGSTVNRTAPPVREGMKAVCRKCQQSFVVGQGASCVFGRYHVPSQLLKDNDWRAKILMPSRTHAALKRQLRLDVAWLRGHGIMDYSLLVGVQRQRYPVSNPGHSGPRGGPRARRRSLAAGSDHATNDWRIQPLIVEGPATYKICIIDMLQQWTLEKQGENMLKTFFLCKSRAGISAVEPELYAERFLEFMEEDVMERMAPHVHVVATAQSFALDVSELKTYEEFVSAVALRLHDTPDTNSISVVSGEGRVTAATYARHRAAWRRATAEMPRVTVASFR